MKLASIVLLAVATLAGTAQAANDPGRPGVSVATGTCSRLITGGDDYSAKCASQLASVTQDDGMVLFVFSVDGTLVAFKGDGKSVGPSFAGAQRLPIGTVELNGPSGTALKADGSCSFADPYAGKPAAVWCAALTEGGPFLGVFQTDGKPPVEQK